MLMLLPPPFFAVSAQAGQSKTRRSAIFKRLVLNSQVFPLFKLANYIPNQPRTTTLPDFW
jgi:hypothetical protein